MRENLLSLSEIDDLSLEEINQQLAVIKAMLQDEMVAKQSTMQAQQEKITQLMSLIERKNNLISDLSQKLENSTRQAEGNRQLVNKLLSDIDRLQQDVGWYQRTYEKRSLLGYLKEKLLQK